MAEAVTWSKGPIPRPPRVLTLQAPRAHAGPVMFQAPKRRLWSGRCLTLMAIRSLFDKAARGRNAPQTSVVEALWWWCCGLIPLCARSPAAGGLTRRAGERMVSRSIRVSESSRHVRGRPSQSESESFQMIHMGWRKAEVRLMTIQLQLQFHYQYVTCCTSGGRQA